MYILVLVFGESLQANFPTNMSAGHSISGSDQSLPLTEFLRQVMAKM